MMMYLLLNDWIFVAIIAVIIVGTSISSYFLGRSNGYTTAWASAKLNRWMDGTFVKCNDGQYRSLSTVQENMGTNEFCNAYNEKMKTQQELADGWRKTAKEDAMYFQFNCIEARVPEYVSFKIPVNGAK